MTDTGTVIHRLENGDYDERLRSVYEEEENIRYQKARYKDAVQSYVDCFGHGEVEIYSAPGRSEIGGNHTDHQHGEVLAAAISSDAIAVAGPLGGDAVTVVSDGYGRISFPLSGLDCKEEEKGTALALTKGVVAGAKRRGRPVGGFQAYITSDVLIGAGLSSSAAYETLIGAILSGFFNGGGISPAELAMIGQYAENVYFGKPCGLMDQMACSVGNLVHIDFADPDAPKVDKVDFDLYKAGYSLCITDTKGSHADLTADYAAIPEEMKQVSGFFGKEFLAEVSVGQFLQQLPRLREAAGDRAVLRAFHFLSENVRVRKEVEAVRQGKIDEFLELVRESGNSSFQYLQNVYSNQNVRRQDLSVALALSDMLLGNNGVSRVHGGGFAGTIQAFVKNGEADGYRKGMDDVFGRGSSRILKVRRHGGIKVL